MNVAYGNKPAANARRTAARLAIFTCTMLVLGLITTVAVAWLCAWFMPLGRVCNERTHSRDEVPRWFVQTRSLPGVVQVEAWHETDYAPAVEAPPAWSGIAADPGPQVDDHGRPIATAAGWPALALTWHANTTDARRPWSWNNLAGHATPTFDSMFGGLLHERHGRRSITNGAIERVLPLEPIVSGVMLNSAVYAAAWALMLTCWRARRRLRSVARGQCAACGYSLQGLPEPRCPECGAAHDRHAMRCDRIVAIAGHGVAAIIGGCTITIALAWTCSVLVGFDSGKSRLAWPKSVGGDWLLNRHDGFGSVRVAWLFDEATAHSIARTDAIRDSVQSQSGPPLHSRQLLEWMDKRLEARMQSLQRIAVDSDIIPAWMQRSCPDASSTRPWKVRSFAREGRGWSLPALGLEMDLATPADVLTLNDNDVRCGPVAGAIPLEPFKTKSLADPVGLPMRIIWRGFVIDSAVFALLLLVLGVTARRLRTRNVVQCAPAK